MARICIVNLTMQLAMEDQKVLNLKEIGIKGLNWTASDESSEYAILD